MKQTVISTRRPTESDGDHNGDVLYFAPNGTIAPVPFNMVWRGEGWRRLNEGDYAHRGRHSFKGVAAAVLLCVLCASAFAGSLTIRPNDYDHRLYVTTTDGELLGGVDIGSAAKVRFDLTAYNAAGIESEHSGATPFDFTPAAFRNISARAKVDRSNFLFASFIISNQEARVLVRALGPSVVGLAGALADPVLEIRTSAGQLMANNDDWKTPPSNQTAIAATGQAPANDRESAIAMTLKPGAYIATVHGKGNKAGAVLVQAVILP